MSGAVRSLAARSGPRVCLLSLPNIKHLPTPKQEAKVLITHKEGGQVLPTPKKRGKVLPTSKKEENVLPVQNCATLATPQSVFFYFRIIPWVAYKTGK